MGMNKSIAYDNSRDHRSPNRGLKYQRLGKNGQFCQKFIKWLLTQKWLNVVS